MSPTGSVVGTVATFLLGFSSVLAAQVDISKLPPSATNTIEFARDIRPIFETSCLRCHGPEKPKGGFRLDNREAALKGGNEGVDIHPGDGAKSPLIHYVAHLVEDMEMPPKGKGAQLTPHEVSQLRAWIDQGAVWAETEATNAESLVLTAGYGRTTINGDHQKYREHYWRKDGPIPALESLEFREQLGLDSHLTLSGHVWENDYRLAVTAEKSQLGFINAGWEQYRKYYDDTGGYRPSPSTPRAISLGEDLNLDIGKAWFDIGLTLPNWPRMVLGYEYDYRRGDEAITSWQGYGSGFDERNIAPASKHLREGVHIIKFDFDYEVGGFAIEDRFRGEFYNLDTHYTNTAARGPVSQDAKQETHYFNGANTVRVEKPIKDLLLLSGGYLYSQLDADSDFQNTATYLDVPTTASVPNISLERDSHVFNANGLAGPFVGLTAVAGVQSEWTRESGFGSGILHLIPFTFQTANLATNPATVLSQHDESVLSENFALRYSTIPFTLLFAEARLRQQSFGQYQYDLQTTPNPSYMDNIDFTSHLTDLRAGFTTSPWKPVSFSAHYRWTDEDSHYHNAEPASPTGGYPGAIRARELQNDEVQAKLGLRVNSWIKTSLSYQYLTSDSWTDTHPAFNTAPPPNSSPGGNLLAGQMDSQIYSIGATLTPHQRLYLDTTFSYQKSKVITANNDVPTIAPYRGDIYSAITSGNYVVSEKVDIFGSYSYSRGDYAQDNVVAGVPLGLKYQQHAAQAGVAYHLSKNVTAQFRYGLYYYDEPSSGGANNYTAQSVFAALTIRLP